MPVSWPDGQISYDLARSDDPLRAAGVAAVDRAFVRWRDADCGGGRHPELRIAAHPGDAPSTIRGAHVGLITFSDDWPARGGGTFAVTRLSFAPDTGRVLRARIVFYTTQLTPHGVGDFLDSIALHEAGHFLGLAHSADPSAVMSEEVHGGAAARTDLAPDDVAAVCAIYPPRDARALPHRGGSFVAAILPAIVAAILAAILVAGLLGWLARRRRATCRRAT